MHINRGLAGAEPGTIASVSATATHPSVCTAFALAMVGAEDGPAVPGIPGHEPSVERGRAATKRVRRSMSELTTLAPNNGAYLAESNYFDPNFQYAYWGHNYERLGRSNRRMIRTVYSLSIMAWVQKPGRIMVSPERYNRRHFDPH